MSCVRVRVPLHSGPGRTARVGVHGSPGVRRRSPAPGLSSGFRTPGQDGAGLGEPGAGWANFMTGRVRERAQPPPGQAASRGTPGQRGEEAHGHLRLFLSSC